MLMTEPKTLPSDGRPGDVARRGFLQYSRAVPHTLRPDQFVRISADPHRIGMGLNFRNHFHIVEIGKDQVPATLKKMKAEPAPEIDQTLLRMTIKSPIAFHLAELDGSTHKLEGQSRGAEFLADRQTLDLGEIREIANPDAARRLAPDIPDKVRGRHVIAVEFFVIGAFLLSHINGAANGDDAQKIFEGMRHRYAETVRLSVGAITVIERRLLWRAREFVEMRGDDSADRGPFF